MIKSGKSPKNRESTKRTTKGKSGQTSPNRHRNHCAFLSQMSPSPARPQWGYCFPPTSQIASQSLALFRSKRNCRGILEGRRPLGPKNSEKSSCPYNSGAGKGCVNFMDAWKNAFFLQEKPMSIKFLVLGGGGILGFFWGGECPFYFYGRADFF